MTGLAVLDLTARLFAQGRGAEVDELLLDIYSNINEPDSIYAVAKGHSMVSQLKLYEHEGSWDKALTGYDLLCRQRAASEAQESPGQATGVSGQVSGQWQKGLLTSLQQLGCRHVIEAYWQHGQAQTAGKHTTIKCISAHHMYLQHVAC